MTDAIKLATYAGGTAGLTALSAMGTAVKEPADVLYYPYATTIRTGDGSARGVGLPYATLSWKNIPRAQRDMLRTYCTGASADVYAMLPTNDSNKTYATYSGVMIWPKKEPYGYGVQDEIISDFTVTIAQLVPA